MQLSNNCFETLPEDFSERFGVVDNASGVLAKDESVKVMIVGNPIVDNWVEEERLRKKAEKEQMEIDNNDEETMELDN